MTFAKRLRELRSTGAMADTISLRVFLFDNAEAIADLAEAAERFDERGCICPGDDICRPPCGVEALFRALKKLNGGAG